MTIREALTSLGYDLTAQVTYSPFERQLDTEVQDNEIEVSERHCRPTSDNIDAVAVRVIRKGDWFWNGPVVFLPFSQAKKAQKWDLSWSYVLHPTL